jgi:hypothetical protein
MNYTIVLALPSCPRNPVFEVNNWNSPVFSDELHAATAASIARIIPGAPAQNRPAFYKMLARESAAVLAASRQESLDATWDLAASIGLPQAIGTATVQQILADFFGGRPITDRDDGSFADACREADRQHRMRARKPSERRPHIPESTRQAVDWLRKYRGDDDLRKFLRGRSKEQIQLIVQYLSRTKS